MKTTKPKRNTRLPPTPLDGLTELFKRAADLDRVPALLGELFTPRELHDFALRLRLLRMLCGGVSQRSISAELGVSLCKVTRGSRILKNPDSAVKKILEKS